MGLPSLFESPILRDDLPRYPPLIQLCRVTATTTPGPSGYASSSVLGPVIYIAFTQQLQTDTLMPRDREPCLVNDINGFGLSPGYYVCRLAGSYTALPLYEAVGAAITPVSLPGLTATQLNSILINLSTTQISKLNNLNACQLQTFLTLNISQQQTITNTLTATELSNLISFITSTQLQNLISTLTLTQLQQLTDVFNPLQISLLLQTFTATQIQTLLLNLTNNQLLELVRYTANQMLLLFNTLTTAQLKAFLNLNPTPFKDSTRRAISDAATTALTTDSIIAYTAITATRIVTLPAANTVWNGFQMMLVDESGSASSSIKIQLAPTGADTINGSNSTFDAITTAREAVWLETDGVSAWTAQKFPGSSPLTTKGDIFGFDTGNNRIPVGTNGQVLTADSTQALGVKWGTAGGTYLGKVLTTVYVNGTNTFSKNASTIWIRVTVIGGGGGGGGSASGAASAAAGGGGGGGSMSFWEGAATSLNASETATVGAGGTGGAAGPNNGGAGGDSTLTINAIGTIYGKGGSGGSGGAFGVTPAFTGGGTGGTTFGNGLFKSQGSDGGPGIVLSGTVAWSGAGGAAAALGCSLSGGGGGSGTSGSYASNGGPVGSGGSGGCTVNNGGAAAGGSGCPGFILIEEFY